MGRFQNKVALVSGSSRGVGFATASELVREGAKVVLTARGEQRLTDARETLARMGGEVASVAGDVGRWADAERMVGTAIERFGCLDILINNAGVSMRGRFQELSPAVCEETIRTNLMGSVYLSRAAIPHIIQQKGHVIFISSIAGMFGLPGASTYCASKGALTGLCEALRLELIPQGVHVGVVYLGFTEHDPEKRILAADGSKVLPDRPAHHTQAQAAGRILKMLEKRRRRLVLTPAGISGWLLYRLSPSLLERLVLWAQTTQLGVFRRFS